MKRRKIALLSLFLCLVLCMSACTKGGDVSTSTEGATENVTQPETENDPPSSTVKDSADLIDANFYGLEGKDHGDVSFSFISSGVSRVLKQERVSFSENSLPTQNGKKWDGASNKWVTASEQTTSSKTYTIDFKRSFTDGNLVVKFQFMRSGGKQQTYAIKLSGVSNSVCGVEISNDSLKIADEEPKWTSNSLKSTNIPADEWCSANIVYSLYQGKISVTAVITDEYGEVLVSATSESQSIVATAITGIDLVDFCNKNVADFSESAPEHPTSVWQIKNFMVQDNPLKTGDTVKLQYQTFKSQDGYEINFLSVNGAYTIRPYFGRYAFLPDNSGFICGTADGSFYRYDIEKQELVYLDKTLPSPQRLDVYLNPKTGNVFYMQLNEKNHKVLYKINPTTFEKTALYEIENSKMDVGLEVSYDEKYTSYSIGGWGYANVPMKMGRINLETGTIDLEQELVYDDDYCINHLILNPAHPELLLFHREQARGANKKDHTNVMNLETGEMITYQQPGDTSAHALWTNEGENIALTDYTTVMSITVLTKDLQLVSTKVMVNGNHIMVDDSLTWALGDASGVSLMNLKTGKSYRLIRVLYGNERGDPFHGHSEITSDGELLNWGYVHENGVLGVAFMTNPEFEK